MGIRGRFERIAGPPEPADFVGAQHTVARLRRLRSRHACNRIDLDPALALEPSEQCPLIADRYRSGKPLNPTRRASSGILPCNKQSRRDHRLTIRSPRRRVRVASPEIPSAFAVLRLITIFYLVGACTGRSAGVLRITPK